jgi:GNAT superfamily N-acetyltransferase
VLYALGLVVTKEYRGAKLGSRLLDARYEFVIKTDTSE